MPTSPLYVFPYSDAPRNQHHNASRNVHTGRLANRFGDVDLNMHHPPGSAHTQPNTRIRFPSMSSLEDALPRNPCPSRKEQLARPQRPETLIVGLFALRLTRRLIQQLDPYETHGSDLRWLGQFLQPYCADDALARLSDTRAMEVYVREYPALVRRMIRQPGYRRLFMEMEPKNRAADRELNDDELRAMVDFADAAGEWGSIVPLPARYAARMEELAKGRRMAV